MPTFKEKTQTTDYEQKIESETEIKNNPKREDIEAAIIFSGLNLPISNMSYKMFDKKGNMLSVTYVFSTDEYYIFVGKKAG